MCCLHTWLCLSFFNEFFLPPACTLPYTAMRLFWCSFLSFTEVVTHGPYNFELEIMTLWAYIFPHFWISLISIFHSPIQYTNQNLFKFFYCENVSRFMKEKISLSIKSLSMSLKNKWIAGCFLYSSWNTYMLLNWVYTRRYVYWLAVHRTLTLK